MTVLQSAVERITADEAAARAAGFSPKPPVYAAGTQIISTGKQNLRQSRRDYDALPSWREGVDEFVESIRSEKRQDGADISLDRVRIAHSDTDRTQVLMQAMHGGQLVNIPLGLETSAARQLFSIISPDKAGAAKFLSNIPPYMRTDVANQLLDLHNAQDTGRRYRFRTRVGSDGERQVYAVVSDQYTPFDVDKVAVMLRDMMPSDSKAEIVYTGNRASLTALYHAPEHEDFAAGDMFKAGVTFTTADDGSKSLQAEASLWRNLCLNLIIVDKSVVDCGKAVHKGDLTDFNHRAHDMLHRGMDAIGHFQNLWVKAEADDIMKRCTPEEAIGRMVHRGIISAPGYGRNKEELASRILSSYSEEPGYGVTSIVNAVTRAAHQYHWNSLWSAKDLERQASVLLSNRGKSKRYSLDVEGSAEETEFIHTKVLSQPRLAQPSPVYDAGVPSSGNGSSEGSLLEF